MSVAADKPPSSAPGQNRRAHTDRTLTALVAIALFAFFIAIQRGEYVGWDGRVMAGVTSNIWEHGRLQSFGPLFPDGPPAEAYSKYGIGQSLLLLPFYGIQRLGSTEDAQWMTLANPLVLAACGVCLYRIGVAIGFRRTTSVGVALVFGTLTMAPLYSTELFAEPAVTLGTVVAVLGMIRWRNDDRIGPWLVGLSVAISILFRIDSLVLIGIALLAVPIFVPIARLHASWRFWGPAVAMPIAAAGAWQGYYNNLRYGMPFRDSYAGARFDNPILHGLGRQLLSPGKGFFWYVPILLAALPGFVWLWRRDRSLTILISGLAAVRVAFLARTPFSDGSVAWGPRFLLPWCALLVIPLGAVWERVTSWIGSKRLAGMAVLVVLGLMSAVTVVASLWVPYEQYWTDIGIEASLLPTDRYEEFISQHVDQSYNTIAGSPLVVNLGSLNEGSPFPLRWFRGGATVFGVVAFTVAVAAATLAIRIARRADRASRELRARRDIDPARTRTEERSALLGS